MKHPYSKILDHCSVLSKEEQIDLFKKWQQNGDKKALDKFIKSGMKFAYQMALKYKGYKYVEFEELVQEANLGLLEAAEQYNPNLGYAFITFAVFKIKDKLRKLVFRNQKNPFLKEFGSKKKAIFDKLSKVTEVSNTWDPELRDQLRENLAKEIGVTVKDLVDFENQCIKVTVSPEVYEDGYTNLFYFDNLEQKVDQKRLHSLVKKCFTKSPLSDKERKILLETVMDDDPKTNSFLGKELGVSREAIRQSRNKALKKVKQVLEEDCVI